MIACGYIGKEAREILFKELFEQTNFTKVTFLISAYFKDSSILLINKKMIAE